MVYLVEIAFLKFPTLKNHKVIARENELAIAMKYGISHLDTVVHFIIRGREELR